ncbi:MAG: hypothetical protein ABSB24_03565 [Gaiellaceae bacterium]
MGETSQGSVKTRKRATTPPSPPLPIYFVDDQLRDEERERIRRARFSPLYHESDVGHTIDPAHIAPAIAWLDAKLP